MSLSALLASEVPFKALLNDNLQMFPKTKFKIHKDHEAKFICNTHFPRTNSVQFALKLLMHVTPRLRSEGLVLAWDSGCSSQPSHYHHHIPPYHHHPHAFNILMITLTAFIFTIILITTSRMFGEGRGFFSPPLDSTGKDCACQLTASRRQESQLIAPSSSSVPGPPSSSPLSGQVHRA